MAAPTEEYTPPRKNIWEGGTTGTGGATSFSRDSGLLKIRICGSAIPIAGSSALRNGLEASEAWAGKRAGNPSTEFGLLSVYGWRSSVLFASATTLTASLESSWDVAVDDSTSFSLDGVLLSGWDGNTATLLSRTARTGTMEACTCKGEVAEGIASSSTDGVLLNDHGWCATVHLDESSAFKNRPERSRHSGTKGEHLIKSLLRTEPSL